MKNMSKKFSKINKNTLKRSRITRKISKINLYLKSMKTMKEHDNSYFWKSQ